MHAHKSRSNQHTSLMLVTRPRGEECRSATSSLLRGTSCWRIQRGPQQDSRLCPTCPDAVNEAVGGLRSA